MLVLSFLINSTAFYFSFAKYELVPAVDEDEKNRLRVRNADSLFLNALEGFLLVTTADGDIVFISENVNRYLGLSQVNDHSGCTYQPSYSLRKHAVCHAMFATNSVSHNASTLPKILLSIYHFNIDC